MNRLGVRLTLAFVLITLIGVGSVILLVDWSAGSEFRQYVVRQGMLDQNGLVDELGAYYAQQGSWQGVGSILSTYQPGRGRGMGGPGRMGRGAGPSLLLADASGRVVYDETGSDTGKSISATDHANSIPVQSDGTTVGYLLMVAPAGSALQPAAQAFLDHLRTTLLAVGLMVALVGIVLGFVISRNLAAPLAGLAKGAHAVAGHKLDQRVPVGGPDEVAQVARAFNEMADELQASDTARRNMVADIAHELRTPLTVMQGNLRAMLDGVYPLQQSEIATLYDETRVLSRLVDDLRELALADAGQLSLNLQSISVAPLLQNMASQFAIPAEERQVRIEVAVDNDLRPVRGDPDRTAQVLRNFVSNALRYTPEKGRIALTAQMETPGAVMRISVSDTGKGISPEDAGHVFERFYRVDRSRGARSIGLGLAIAKAWVEAMGGQIGVDSAPGKGSTFWFLLPLAK